MTRDRRWYGWLELAHEVQLNGDLLWRALPDLTQMGLLIPHPENKDRESGVMPRWRICKRDLWPDIVESIQAQEATLLLRCMEDENGSYRVTRITPATPIRIESK